MTLIPFNDGWTVRDSSGAVTNVTLPHDAMISETRSASAPSGAHGSYFPGGHYTYTREWTAPTDSENVSLIFEGVYGITVVRVNGVIVAENASGYREFVVPLSGVVAPGSTALIEVEVDNWGQPNSRWYTGSGIYRPVWLESVGATRIARDGVSITTRSIDGAAIVDILVEIDGGSDQGAEVTATFQGPDGSLHTAAGIAVGSHAVMRLGIENALLWSDLQPNLYTARIELAIDGIAVDERELSVGLRTVEVDAARGLRVNGRSVLLRGACVHHDSGILGAATLRASEFRRARILKQAGFNAVRSSHNPLSRDFLDACDTYGLYVLDELTDVWFGPKSTHDLASRFNELWRDDARSMVQKDRNHASVIMYSIGNEIAESGTPRGVAAAQAISGLLRDLDPTRPTTIAVNFLLNVMAASGRTPFDTSEHDEGRADTGSSPVTSTVANVTANRIGMMLQLISKLPRANKVSRDTFSAVDIAGYNYAWGRYAGDAKRHPERVVLGTESMPGDIPRIWALAERLPNVIGDFVWTGWDYLGEAGIGTWTYGNQPAAIAKKYPEIIAGCGLIDITGTPGGALLLSQATWGQLDSPGVAVRPLDRAGQRAHRIAWRSTDAIESWAWSGADGKQAEVEVYSSGDSVQLLLNGRSLGRKMVRGFVARFRVPYAPGELVAIGYRNGVETGRTTLRSAGTPTVRLTVEPQDDATDAIFVRIELADENGVVEMLADDSVTVEVTGGAVLAALGSGAPATEGTYADAKHATHYGRALAVLRPLGTEKDATLTVTSLKHGSASVAITIRETTNSRSRT